ncbi:MAG: cytochrome c [Burkholderiales bacterium]|nr:cytochrome c [Burkholderiales bacterium]
MQHSRFLPRFLQRLLVAAALAAGLASAVAQGGPVLERGRYLVTTILACGNCHTPKDGEGRAIAAKELAGGGIAFDIPPFAGVAANITPDKETGIGSWSDAEIKRAITHGERPAHGPLAGKPLALPMAANFFKAILPGDLDAIVAYLRSVPAVRNPLPAPVYRAPVHREAFALADQGFGERDLQDKVRRGAYLATIGHCLECHTPVDKGVLQLDAALGAGGRPFMPSFVKGLPESWKGAVSRNLTSDRERGLGAWSDAEIRRAIVQGVGRDGRRMQEPMPYAWYAGLRDDDLDAIVAYLRTLPPLPR